MPSVIESSIFELTLNELNELFGKYTFISEEATDFGKIYIVFDKGESRLLKIQAFNLNELKKERQKYYIKYFKSILSVKHPNMQPILDHWVHDGHLFVGTNELEQSNLIKYIQDSRCPFHEVLEIGIQVGSALEMLHNRKMGYGGLSTADIFVDSKNGVILLPPMLTKICKEIELARGDQALLEEDNLSHTPIFSTQDRELDITTFGRIICFISTGYMLEEISSKKWEAYGLDKVLIDIVHTAIHDPGFKLPAKINTIVDQLVDLQSKYYSTHDVSYKCLSTRFLRESIYHNWSLDNVYSEHSSVDEKRLQKEGVEAKSILFDKRFEVKDCVPTKNVITTFDALDQRDGGIPVLLPVFKVDIDKEPAKEFRKLANKLRHFSHPNISPIVDAQIMKLVAYVVYRKEEFETLEAFVQHKDFTIPEILNFMKQVLSALHECDKLELPYHDLHIKNILVKEEEDKSFSYQLMHVGLEAFTDITSPDIDITDRYECPETIAPEIYEGKGIGFNTTQYSLSQIIYRLLKKTHPTEGHSIKEAKDYHMSMGKFKRDEFPDMPTSLLAWLNKISSPLVERRYFHAEQMLEHLLILEKEVIEELNRGPEDDAFDSLLSAQRTNIQSP